MTDPIAQIEADLAHELAELHRRLAFAPTRSHVHLREDTVVYLVDGPWLPRLSAERRREATEGIADVARRVLGRELIDVHVSRVTAGSLVVVLRLA